MVAIQYPDKWVRVIGIPVWAILFRFIGDPSPLGNLFLNPLFYLDMAVIMGVNILLWELNRWLIRTMDRRYSWADQPLQRLVAQGGLAITSTGLVIAVFSVIYNKFVLKRPPPFDLSITISNDVPIGLLFIVILHLAYTLYWMIVYHRQTVAGFVQQLAALQAGPEVRSETIENRTPALKTLLVNQGKGFVPVSIEQVAYIFITNEISIVKTTDSQSFTVDATLEQLSERLPADAFFRTSRQFITHRRAIRKVENDGSGRLVLHLQPAHTEEVAVSRRRVAEFRQWMGA
ncbi:hypothetical protein GCM10028803_06670 [Larkinella knui]|uniref:LytTR family transcriptional regulator n=1 Tax=Larkinella knui TaxID=2025310 RepID=A0A3P1CK79_9BACT|nr:LytTR family DNA-binding domain-containing protein [Larkinella knui]RRB13659.1 LytTR family transcriptional regulator [Larkinella knui]